MSKTENTCALCAKRRARGKEKYYERTAKDPLHNSKKNAIYYAKIKQDPERYERMKEVARKRNERYRKKIKLLKGKAEPQKAVEVKFSSGGETKLPTTLAVSLLRLSNSKEEK